MPVATRRELLEAGVHFGHQTRRWNPKMRRYIFGERSGIYIIDLEKTLSGLQRAYEFLMDIGRRSGVVLFVGTKKQAQETILEQAGRVNMPHVTTRWLGGMLTNFQTMHTRLKRLKELREMERSGAFEFLPKKEVLKLRHEKEKLDRNLSGLQDMERLPDTIFVIDTKREHIAVKEARKLGIPVIAIVDTNCDPDEVDYVIPGNDDAIRACALITKVAADAIQEGQYLAYQGMAGRTFEPEFEKEPAVAASTPVEERRAVQLSEEEQAYLGALETESTGEATEPETEPEPVDTSATWAAPAAPGEMEAQTHPDVAGTEAAEGEVLEAEMDSRLEPDAQGEGSGDPQAEDGESEPEEAEGSGQPDRAGRRA
jgi:small subunit ribosomal protein S2